MTQIAKFQIESVFEITGRGLVFAGRILDGLVSRGNQVEFKLNNNLLRRKITGIEEITHTNSEKVNFGLLIKCHSKEEIKKIKDSKEILSVVNIYNENLKLSELIKWLSTKPIEHKRLFMELFLSNLTVMNRAIWSDENTDNKSKVISLKWSNELSHRIWNILFDLRRNNNNDSEIKLGENINFFGRQSRELAGHLNSIIKTTVNRFYELVEKNNNNKTETSTQQGKYDH